MWLLLTAVDMDPLYSLRYAGLPYRRFFSPPFPVRRGLPGMHELGSFSPIVLGEAYSGANRADRNSRPGRRQIPITVDEEGEERETIRLTNAGGQLLDMQAKRRAERQARARGATTWSEDTLSEADEDDEPHSFSGGRNDDALAAGVPPLVQSVPVARPRATTAAIPITDAFAGALHADVAPFDSALQRQHALRVLPTSPDGNCWYRATALQVYGDAEQHRRVRDSIVAYMRGESEAGQAGSDPRGEGRAAARAADITRQFFTDLVHASEGEHVSLDAYLDRMSVPGSWAGYIEMLAAEELYDRPLQVWYVPQPAGLGKAQRAEVPASALEPHGIHFSGELPSLPGVEPLRYAYSRGNHFDAVVPRACVKVTRVYRDASEAYEDEAWDNHEDGQGEQGMLGLYQLPWVGQSEAGSTAADLEDGQQGRGNEALQDWHMEADAALAAALAEDTDEEGWDWVDDGPGTGPGRAFDVRAGAGTARAHLTGPWLRYRIQPPCPPRRTRLIRASRQKRLLQGMGSGAGRAGEG